jgi:protease PrsW
MIFHYRDSNGAKAGPYTADELRQLHLSGVVKPETEVFEGDAAGGVAFREVWPRISAGASSADPARTRSAFEDLTQRTTEDIRALIPHLLVPLQDLRTLKWIGDKRLLAIALIGLLPLFLLVVFAGRGDVKAAYWGLALYVSVLWAVFFYYVFPAPRILLRQAALCFFVTGVISIAVLLMAYKVPPLNWMVRFTQSPSLLGQTFGYIFGVGIPEELCKALVLFFMVRRRVLLPPQALLFYGLMSGLGFGIYEGINYQMGRNLAGSKASYYLNNILRLTSLPFLHAIWTGIAGYFIGFAYQYPRRKYGLLVIAIGLPSLLHGLYDVFSDNVIGLLLALLSVLALYLYLAKSVYFESVLAGKPTTSTPPPVPEPPSVPPTLPPGGPPTSM